MSVIQIRVSTLALAKDELIHITANVLITYKEEIVPKTKREFAVDSTLAFMAIVVQVEME